MWYYDDDDDGGDDDVFRWATLPPYSLLVLGSRRGEAGEDLDRVPNPLAPEDLDLQVFVNRSSQKRLQLHVLEQYLLKSYLILNFGLSTHAIEND